MTEAVRKCKVEISLTGCWTVISKENEIVGIQTSLLMKVQLH